MTTTSVGSSETCSMQSRPPTYSSSPEDILSLSSGTLQDAESTISLQRGRPRRWDPLLCVLAILRFITPFISLSVVIFAGNANTQYFANRKILVTGWERAWPDRIIMGDAGAMLIIGVLSMLYSLLNLWRCRQPEGMFIFELSLFLISFTLTMPFAWGATPYGFQTSPAEISSRSTLRVWACYMDVTGNSRVIPYGSICSSLVSC